MARYTPKNFGGDLAPLNPEFEKIKQAIDSTLSRIGETPNSVVATMDFNGQRIINLPAPESNTEPFRKLDLPDTIGKIAAKGDEVLEKIQADENQIEQFAMDAGNSATEASNSASAASTSENNASGFATNAQEYAQDALDYRDTTLTYRNEAEVFRDEAQSASGAAEIGKPSITQPTNGQTDFSGEVLASAYQTGSQFYGAHDRSEWQIARDSAFTDIVDEVDNTTDLLSWTPALAGFANKTLYSRVRYGSDNHWSQWSDTVSFITPDIFVDAPVLTVEGGPSDVPESPELSTSAFSVINGTDTHESTDWQVVRTSDGAVVWESLSDTSNLLSITVPSGVLVESAEYRFRVRHRGATYGSSDWTEVTATTSAAFLDLGVGGQTLLAGDMTNGYFGEVTSAELFSGDELATDVGLTAGVSINSSGGWLKFARNGDIIYIAKKPFRHSASWDDIYAAGLVYGTDDNGLAPTGTPTNQLTTVTKDGRSYICRLMTGAYDDPFMDTGRNGVDLTSSSSCQGEYGLGSEWNDLMYKVHQDVPTCPNSKDYDGGAQIGSNWDTLTDADIVVSSGDGRASWCQEQSSITTSDRCYRGSIRLSVLFRIPSSRSASDVGWRPVLVLQQQ